MCVYPSMREVASLVLWRRQLKHIIDFIVIWHRPFVHALCVWVDNVEASRCLSVYPSDSGPPMFKFYGQGMYDMATAYYGGYFQDTIASISALFIHQYLVMCPGA